MYRLLISHLAWFIETQLAAYSSLSSLSLSPSLLAFDMANFIPTGTSKPRATPKTIVVSPITSPPILTHQRDLIKRAETVGDNTCGWVNGDLSET